MTRQKNSAQCEFGAARYRYLGTNDEAEECSCCGKTGLKRVVWLVGLDEDGNEIGEAAPYGTTCAGHLLAGRHTVKKPTKSQSEKLIEDAKRETVRAAIAEALVLEPPAGEPGVNDYGVHIIRIGDVESVRMSRGTGPIEYDMAIAQERWYTMRAAEVLQRWGIARDQISWYDVQKEFSSNERLERMAHRIANF